MSVEQPALNGARFSLSAVAAVCSGQLEGTAAVALEVCGVSTDTRTLQEGALFVALRGERFDGHRFLDQAASQGARAAVVDKAFMDSAPLPLVRVGDTLQAFGAIGRAQRRKFAVPVIGITGSYGKTTTRAFIAAALGARLNVLASAGNFNNEIGVPQTLLQLTAEHEAAVIEMGMRGAGQIAYLAKIAEPTIGVITNIGPQHIEMFDSLEAIAHAKAELLSALPPDGTAILPADDPFLETLRAHAPCPVLTFGQSANADYRVLNMQSDTAGSVSFSFHAQNSKFKIQNSKLPLPGEHNAINAAAALAVADVLGMPLDEAAHALESVAVPGSRMRIIQQGSMTIIDDCYNAGPNSMQAALQTLLNFPGSGRRVAILGEMRELGAWSEGEHRKVGALAGTFADVIIGVGGATRPLLNAAVESAATVEAQPELVWCEDAETAAQRAAELAQAGDVILVKGSNALGLDRVVKALDHE